MEELDRINARLNHDINCFNDKEKKDLDFKKKNERLEKQNNLLKNEND